MSEYDPYRQFRTPEWAAPHASLVKRVEEAAQGLWTPAANNPTEFTCDCSAAGGMLRAHFKPAITDGGEPQCEITVEDASRRLGEGADRGFGIIANIDAASFTIYNPEDATALSSRGVECVLISSQNKREVFNDSVPYERFEYFANVSGLFVGAEPMRHPQGLGRRALQLVANYIATHKNK